MKKMKYESAVMELVEFDFEDVLEGSNDNVADGSGIGGYSDDKTNDNPWGNSNS